MPCPSPDTVAPTPTKPCNRISVASIAQKYQILEELGDGAHSRVVSAKHLESGETRAIKIMEKKAIRKPPEDACETEVLSTTDHDNIIRLHEVLETPSEVFMVFDRMDTDLFQTLASSRLNRMKEKDVRQVAKALLSAIAYLHKSEVVHRDIKLENILMNGIDDVRLGDFGFAKVATDSNKPVGTSFYMPPEVLAALEAQGVLDRLTVKAGDMWSIGIVVHFLLSGRPPFLGKAWPPVERRKLMQQMEKGPTFPTERWDGVTPEAREFVSMLLNSEPSQRPTAAEALNHRWICSESAPPAEEATIELDSPASMHMPRRVPVSCPA